MDSIESRLKNLPTAEPERLKSLAEARGLKARQPEPIVRQARAGRFKLSFAQQRLWFLAQLDPVSATYNTPMGWRLRGRLDTAAWRSCLDALVARHESLRTVIAT